MIHKFDFKKTISNIRLPKRTEFRTISAKAHHDWKLMVLAFIFLSCLAIAGNFYLFWQIDNETYEDTSGNAPSGVVSQKNLEDTVAFFKNRQARLEDLQNHKPQVPDPSF